MSKPTDPASIINSYTPNIIVDSIIASIITGKKSGQFSLKTIGMILLSSSIPEIKKAITDFIPWLIQNFKDFAFTIGLFMTNFIKMFIGINNLNKWNKWKSVKSTDNVNSFTLALLTDYRPKITIDFKIDNPSIFSDFVSYVLKDGHYDSDVKGFNVTTYNSNTQELLIKNIHFPIAYNNYNLHCYLHNDLVIKKHSEQSYEKISSSSNDSSLMSLDDLTNYYNSICVHRFGYGSNAISWKDFKSQKFIQSLSFLNIVVGDVVADRVITKFKSIVAYFNTKNWNDDDLIEYYGNETKLYRLNMSKNQTDSYDIMTYYHKDTLPYKYDELYNNSIISPVSTYMDCVMGLKQYSMTWIIGLISIELLNDYVIKMTHQYLIVFKINNIDTNHEIVSMTPMYGKLNQYVKIDKIDDQLINSNLHKVRMFNTPLNDLNRQHHSENKGTVIQVAGTTSYKLTVSAGNEKENECQMTPDTISNLFKDAFTNVVISRSSAVKKPISIYNISVIKKEITPKATSSLNVPQQNVEESINIANVSNITNMKYENEIKCEKMSECKKSLKTLYLKEDEEKRILSLIKLFTSNELYDKLEIQRQVGILISGLPGTGKTTLLKVLAYEFQLPLYYANLGELTTIGQFKMVSDYIFIKNGGGFLVMEDVDTQTDILLQRKEFEEPQRSCISSFDEGMSLSSKTDNVNMNGDDHPLNQSWFLNWQQGSNTPPNLVYAMSTNYHNKLDSAVTRSGRINVTIKFTECDSHQLKTIFNSIIGHPLDDNLAENFLKKFIENRNENENESKSKHSYYLTPAVVIERLTQHYYDIDLTDEQRLNAINF